MIANNYKKLLNQFKSDRSLLAAYASGDASAFEMLYSKYKDILFNSLYHQLGDSGAAEEVAQDVWMAIIRGAAAFEEPAGADSQTGAFRSWLFAIAHRRSADYWRKQYRLRENEDQTVANEDQGQIAGRVDDQPEHQFLVFEFRQILLELPEDQRQSFILREEGFSYREIADITGAGEETVKSRLRYAKKALQLRLASSP